MRISIVGLGYIGLVLAAVMAEQGNKVIGVDIDIEKLNSISRGEIPIYESGLDTLLEENDIRYSDSYKEVVGSDLIFITVPTPNLHGRIDLNYVYQAAESSAKVSPSSTLVIKSTVVPGTAHEIKERTGMTVVSNPEFTREGSAVKDTKRPDRIVIGGSEFDSVEKLKSLWMFTNSTFLITTCENAEMIKYASNSFLATKISFINELANLCETIPGSDISIVAQGMGMDQRIGADFLNAGLGYGGSCLPKDTRAFVEFAKTKGTELTLIDAAGTVNLNRISHAVDLIRKSLSGTLEHKTISVLGITFKNSTNDVRDSQSILLINSLISESAHVRTFDPIVKYELDGTTICDSMDECLRSSDAVVIATEWPLFSQLNDHDLTIPIIDLRRVLEPSKKGSYTAIGLGNDKTK